MRCLSAVLALVLTALVWLPSAASADGDLAIAHPPNWDQSLAIVHATGTPLDEVEQADGSAGESSNRHAQSNSNGAVLAPATELPLAITTFPTPE